MKNIKIAIGASVLLLALVFNFTLVSKASTYTSSLLSSNNETEEFNERGSGLETPVVGDNAIKVALLLDTSNSMDGLIDQAKSQLWKIVGELARMKKGDETPSLQIALYDYGNDNLSIRNGYIRQISNFTSDMDLISEKLFAMTTNGGSEYCGHVIQTSLRQLEWGKKNNDLKVIYIAGNESFGQGNVPFSDAIRDALEKGIVVNTIFCGPHREGVNLQWQHGALLGKGEYMSIDQDKATVYIKTPYDQQIGDLNLQLNNTYIHYGQKGKRFKENQVMQDSNAGAYSQANVADRAVFKSSASYSNAEWDVVDAYKKDKNIIKEKKKELPAEFQELNAEEVEEKIIEITKERETIQLRIRELDKERRAFIEEEKAKNIGNNAGGTLEESMLKSLRKTAKEKGFGVE